MTIDEWARREAEKYRPGFEDSAHDRDYWEGNAFQGGIVHAFNALLSDDSVDAASRAIWEYQPKEHEKSWGFGPIRAAIQAAIDAVTKGDTE